MLRVEVVQGVIERGSVVVPAKENVRQVRSGFREIRNYLVVVILNDTR